MGGIVDPPKASKNDRCWLEFKPDDNRPRVRSTLVRQSPNKYECAITVDGLTRVELNAMEQMLLGTSYVTVLDGRVHAWTVNDPLPDPIDDPIIAPHWKMADEPKKLGGVPESEGYHFPAIIIWGLGAGGGKGAYERSAKILEDCGFRCLCSSGAAVAALPVERILTQDTP